MTDSVLHFNGYDLHRYVRDVKPGLLHGGRYAPDPKGTLEVVVNEKVKKDFIKYDPKKDTFSAKRETLDKIQLWIDENPAPSLHP